MERRNTRTCGVLLKKCIILSLLITLPKIITDFLPMFVMPLSGINNYYYIIIIITYYSFLLFSFMMANKRLNWQLDNVIIHKICSYAVIGFSFSKYSFSSLLLSPFFFLLSLPSSPFSFLLLPLFLPPSFPLKINLSI